MVVKYIYRLQLTGKTGKFTFFCQPEIFLTSSLVLIHKTSHHSHAFPRLESHRTEKDNSPPSPHLTIFSDGLVRVQNDQVLVSTCRMHVYKFPFDVQSCNLSFKSVVHSGEFIFQHLAPPPPEYSPLPLSRCSRGDRARSPSKLSGGHGHDDANPVRVAVCQHEGYQQDHQHLPAAARCLNFHCESRDLSIHLVQVRTIIYFF